MPWWEAVSTVVILYSEAVLWKPVVPPCWLTCQESLSLETRVQTGLILMCSQDIGRISSESNSIDVAFIYLEADLQKEQLPSPVKAFPLVGTGCSKSGHVLKNAGLASARRDLLFVVDSQRPKRKQQFTFGLATRQTAPVRALEGEELLPAMPGFFEIGVVEGTAFPGPSLLLCQIGH